VTDPIDIGRHQEQNGSAEEPLDALGWISDGDLLLFVERLPVQQRQVLAMRFMLGLSTKQIGEVLDRAPNDIAVLQYRALGFLRTRLSAIGRGPEAQRGGIQMRRWPRPARVLRRRRFALH
jgi:DNA-directed RNA polymerase specialized sigma24 family protein